MSINLTVNGVTFAFPTAGENPGWGSTVTAWAQAVSQTTLQKSGGTFTLTGEVDFGASYGLKLAVVKSRTTGAAQSGFMRLAKTDTIAFRNAAGDGDLAFGVGSADTVPAYAGKDLVNVDAAQTLSNKTIDGSTSTISNVPWASVVKTGSNLTDLATRNHNDLNGKSGGTGAEFYHLTATEYSSLQSIPTDSKEPTGFVDPDNIGIAYDKTAKTITVTHGSGTIAYYIKGVKKTRSSPWTSADHGTSNGYYWLTFSTADSPTWTYNSFPGFDGGVFVAYVNYGATDKFSVKECHGLMPWQTWQHLHQNIGTYRISGGLVTALSYALNTNTVAAVTPDVDECVIRDEDFSTTIPAFTAAQGYTWVHIDAGSAVFTTGSTVPYVNNGTNIQYNQNPASGTALTEMTTPNRYVNVYGIFVPAASDADSQKYRILWMIGQQVYTTSTAAAAEDFRTLNTGNLTTLFAEMLPFIRLTYIRTNSNLTFNAQINLNPTYLTGSRLALVNVSGLSPSDHQALTGRTTADSHPTTAISTTVTNFNRVLSATDDEVQKALDTIDNTVVTLTSTDALENKSLEASCALVDTTDNTKTFKWNLASQSTGVDITLTTGAETANRVLNVPVLGGTRTLVMTDLAQVLTAKDIDGGTASNTSRITVPKDTKANLDSLTRKEGTIVYGSDTDKLYADDGSTLKAIGAAGSGSGETNYVTNPSGTDDNAADVPAGWAESSISNLLDIAVTKTGSELPRENITKSGLKITAKAGVTTVADYVYYDFTLDDVDASGRIMKLKWDQKVTGTYTAGQLEVVITTQADRTTAVVTPFTSAIPASDGTFQTYFLAPSTATCSLVIRATADMTTDGGICISDVVVGPNVQVQGAAIGNWKSYTPTLANITTQNVVGKYREEGDSIRVRIQADPNGTATGTISASIPTGFTINTSDLTGTGTVQNLGTVMGRPVNGATTAVFVGFVQYLSATTVQVFGNDSTAYPGAGGIWSANVPATWAASGDSLAFDFLIPVNELSSNVTLANRAVEEYAYNTNTSDASDTTSFGYGPGGVAFGSYTAERNKYVRFQSPCQPTDSVTMEIYINGNWQNIANSLIPYVAQSGYRYGVVISQINSVDWLVQFQPYARPTGATYASAGEAWSGYTSYKWRVRKTSGGASVGFPVSSANIVGRTDGVAPAAGMVGQILTTGSVTTTAAATWSSGCSTYIDVPAGEWDLSATVMCNAAASNGSYHAAYIGTTQMTSGSAVPTGCTTGFDYMIGSINTTVGLGQTVIPRKPISISTTTRYYFGARSDHTQANDTYLYMSARRIA